MASDKKLPSTSRSLPIAMIRARESIMPPVRQMLAEYGLTEQQWRVLRVLAEHGPLDVSNAAEHAGLLLPSLTRISRSMEEKGLATKSLDSNDRRRQIMSLTQRGQDIVDKNYAKVLRTVEIYKSFLGPERYELLLDILNELTEASDEFVNTDMT